jgi:hypothetical protein
MCLQCAAGALVAGSAATGVRAVVVARAGAWLTPPRRRRLTAALLTAGVLAAGLVGPAGG